MALDYTHVRKCFFALEAFLEWPENTAGLAADATLEDVLAAFLVDNTENFGALDAYLLALVDPLNIDDRLWAELFNAHVVHVEAHVLRVFQTFTLEHRGRLAQLMVEHNRCNFLASYIEACHVAMPARARHVSFLARMAIYVDAIECLRTILEAKVIDISTEIVSIRLHTPTVNFIAFHRQVPIADMPPARAREELRAILGIIGVPTQGASFSYTLAPTLLHVCLQKSNNDAMIAMVLAHAHFSRRQLRSALGSAHSTAIEAALVTTESADDTASSLIFQRYPL